MVTVLLAAFCGEKYIARQLDSLLCQSVMPEKIVIRDDGSTDATVQIIESYRAMYPGIIEICPTETPTGSAAGNFFKMLEIYRDDYIMLCDQDDIWMPEKIEKTLNFMRQKESEYGNIPLLVHTDLVVADSEGHRVAESFVKYQKLTPNNNAINNYLMQNNVTGCTCMLNRALLDMLYAFPAVCTMHDWWLALVASAFGRVEFLNTATIYYCQHKNNTVGAKKAGSLKYIFEKLKNIKNQKRIYTDIITNAEQFLSIYANALPRQQAKYVIAVAHLRGASKAEKIKTIKKYNLQKNTPVRTAVQYIFI